MLLKKIKAIIQLIRPELPLVAGVCVVVGEVLAASQHESLTILHQPILAIGSLPGRAFSAAKLPGWIYLQGRHRDKISFPAGFDVMQRNRRHDHQVVDLLVEIRDDFGQVQAAKESQYFSGGWVSWNWAARLSGKLACLARLRVAVAVGVAIGEGSPVGLEGRVAGDPVLRPSKSQSPKSEQRFSISPANL